MPVGQQFLQSNLFRTLSAFTASVTHLVCWPFVQRSLMQQQHIQVTLAIANHPQNVGRLISSSTTNKHEGMQVSSAFTLAHASTESVQNLPVTGNEPSETTKNGSVWYSNISSLLIQVEESGVRSRPQANPLAQALKNSQCHRFCRRYPMVYSFPEKDPRFCSESVLT